MKVKAPKEDPKLAAQRERAEALAEQEAISETQRRLEDETAAFSRRFGSRAAVGGIPSLFGQRSVAGGNYSPNLRTGFNFGGL